MLPTNKDWKSNPCLVDLPSAADKKLNDEDFELLNTKINNLLKKVDKKQALKELDILRKELCC